MATVIEISLKSKVAVEKVSAQAVKALKDGYSDADQNTRGTAYCGADGAATTANKTADSAQTTRIEQAITQQAMLKVVVCRIHANSEVCPRVGDTCFELWVSCTGRAEEQFLSGWRQNHQGEK